jgi:glycosyltransferase involved in cell wall biosynthesis
MILSVVIPSRNRYDNLKGTLEGLANQTLGKEEYEVILVDDNSSDQTQTLINEFRDRMRFKYIFSTVPKPHSWNASVIRNLGATAADPSTIAYVFVDSDVVLPPYALSYYVEDLNLNSDRVIIGAYDFTTKDGAKVQYANGIEGDVRMLKFKEVNVADTFNTIHDGLACFGGNIVIPKKIFWEVGGFSPDINIGLEDGDMGLKLWKRQTNFSYDRRTWGTHQWHEAPNDRFPPNMADYVEKLNQKHFQMSTKEVGEKIDLIAATRQTYEKWGITKWEVPEEWKKSQIEFMMKIKKI